MKFKSDIQAESKVGIGTATVNYPLDVRAGSANSDIAQFTGANDSRGLKISTFQFAAADDSVDYDCQYSGTAPFVPFGVQTWSMDGSEKMRLTQDGNLGVGTTSPITKLEVSSADQTKLRITSTDTSVAQFDSVGTLEFKANDTNTGGNNVVGFVDCIATADRGDFTTALSFGTSKGGAAAEKMRINPNGDVGIGTSSLTSISITSTTLSLGSVSATTSGGIAFQANGVVKAYNYVASDYLYSQTVTGIGQIFFGAGSERMRIHNTTGNVGINDTSPSYELDVDGEGRFTGDLRCLSLIQTSQSDKKEFISDIVKTTNKKIEFKEYVYKSDSGNRKRYGVLAEDIEVDYPELVHIDADGIKGVNYIDLLVKRVAELERELEDISLTEGPKGDTGSRGLRGYTGTSGSNGSSGTNGADGKDGNSHLSDVSSIGFNEKSGQLEIQIGKEIYRFNQDK